MQDAKKIVSITLIPAVFLWLVGYVAFSVSSLSTTPERKSETTDAIIVATGGNHRIKTGLELFAGGRASHLFISGVNPNTTKRSIMKLWKGDTALPPCCITLGREAKTTRQNAKEARQWVAENDYTSVRLVTSGYHMGRAAMEFRHAMPGIDIIRHPVPYKDYGPGERRYWAIAFSEYNKSLLRGLILFLAPKKKMPEEKPGKERE